MKQVHRRKLKYKWLIPRVGNSIFRSVIFSIFKKINRDPTYIVDLWKRLTVLESLTSIFEKDQFDLCQHRIDLSITKNEQFNKKNIFFVCFWQFRPTFYAKRLKNSLRSSIFDLFQRDQFAIINLWKRSTVIEFIFRSFNHKKRSIWSKNQWSNYLPC